MHVSALHDKTSNQVAFIWRITQTYWNLLFIWPGVAQVHCSSLDTTRHWPL